MAKDKLDHTVQRTLAEGLVSGQFFEPGAFFEGQSEGKWGSFLAHASSLQMSSSGSFAWDFKDLSTSFH